MKGRNKKTVLIWIGGVISLLLVFFVVGAWGMFGTFITAANSVEKTDNKM